MDILPAFTFEPNDVSSDAKSVKPNFEGYSYGGSIELNLMMISMVQPYILAGYTAYKKTEETAPDEFEDSPEEYPLTFGTMIAIKEGIELLAQLDWVLNKDTKKWAETDKSVAVGLNIMLNDNLELITEFGRSLKTEDEDGNEVSPAGWAISVGAIYAL